MWLDLDDIVLAWAECPLLGRAYVFMDCIHIERYNRGV